MPVCLLWGLRGGGVHVWRSGGSAALFCAPVHRITELVSRPVLLVVAAAAKEGEWSRTRSRTRRSTVAPHSPLSEIMCEFFLLVFLALFSGLFPCAEPSTVSDEDKGKKASSPSGMRSPIELGTAARLGAAARLAGSVVL